MLKHIKLKDFKSFVDEEIALSGLTVLVGANASGKSNLLDALRFLQGVALDYTLTDTLRGRWEGGRQVWPGVRGGVTDAARKGTAGFYLESTWGGSSGEAFTHGIGVEAGNHPMLTYEGLWSSAVPPYLFDTAARALRDNTGRDAGSSIRVALKRTGKGNSPTQTHSASRSLLFQIDLSPPVSRDVGRVRDAMSSAIRGAYFLDITPSSMRDYVPKHATDLGLEGDNVSALAWSICQDADAKADLVDWLTELCAPELEDIAFAETELDDVMLVLVEQGGRRIPARSLSDGTLRFLGELIALRTAPEGAVLLMEAAVTERGVQVIATTHSPLVLNALSPSALRDAVMVGRPPGSEGSLLRRLQDLPDFEDIVARRGIDRMLAASWSAVRSERDPTDCELHATDPIRPAPSPVRPNQELP